MRKVKIADTKWISVLNMYGPALNPIPVEDTILRKIIVEGHAVYETDANGVTIPLTVNNYNNPARFANAISASKKVEAKPVYGAKSEVESNVNTFTGYTAQTAPIVPPIVNGPSTNKLSNKQMKELRRKQEAEERAKAKENQQAVVEVATDVEESVETAQD